ncbi:hypothetical protein ACFWM1_18760 [Nocardia sp. NPDC058379]|uniref:hypothetical protein n=1 Tax=unclassified Nocardia TaxID=2637762 RepID=UPI003664BC52
MVPKGQDQRARDEIRSRLEQLREEAEQFRGRNYTWGDLADAVNKTILSHDQTMADARGELPSESSVNDRELVSGQQIGFWVRSGKVAKHFYQLWALVLVLSRDAGLPGPKAAEWKKLWKQARGEPAAAEQTAAAVVPAEIAAATTNRSGRNAGRLWPLGAMVGVVLIGSVATIGVANPWDWQWLEGGPNATASELARTYDPNSPVTVEGVHADREGLNFVVEDQLTLTKDDLRTLSQEATRSPGSNQKRFETQYRGIPQDFANLTMTVSTNLDRPVTITGMRALKECAEPFNGSYFEEYTQGSSSPNVEMGINLDDPDAQARQLDAQGKPTGPAFFQKANVQLKPGDSTTLSIAAFTAKYGCSFKIEITVDAPTGSATQVIDNNGEPFKVTAKAPPTKDSFPLSGYRAAYVQQVGYVWQRVDPPTYRGR